MEKYSPQKHEWGTDASTRYAKSMTPGENKKKGKKMSETKDFFAFRAALAEDGMDGHTVKGGHKRTVKQGAGMTKKGVAKYRRENPGSKLQTAVTTPPSKLKPGSKAAGRRKSFCARSRGWTGERGRAARRRWNC